MLEIAVIVPVYNAEKHLKRCVDSILFQTHQNFRLILVDDGSLDGSPQLCDGYAGKDSRVHVIHQKNGGPSRARNAGIDWAQENTNCAYFAFIDSDDCIHPLYLQRLYSAVLESGAGAAMCMHRYINQGEKFEPGNGNTSAATVQIMHSEELLLKQSSSFNYPWGKLFSRESFAELRYPEDISFGEDNLVIYQALFACKTVAFLEEQLYYYFYNSEGITKSPWSERSLQVFLGIEAQLEYYRTNGFTRAYKKETELYIQQCAYQIHRIRENAQVLCRNRRHLAELKKQMCKILRQSNDFHVWDQFYWYEALHPLAARAYVLFKGLLRRVRENANKLVKN